ncbi:MAG: hypothetical protein K6G29_09635 [Clostridiales bacterium]|nr:hypothetical protein [Clostridiales bacterium]
MKLPKWDRNRWILLLLALMGAALLLLGGLLGDRGGASSDYAGYLEERARNLCLSIDGVEEAEVFLTLDEPAAKTVSAGMFGDSGESVTPGVRGIAVVCTGGDLPRVRATVTELLSAALAVPTNHIRVAGK